MKKYLLNSAVLTSFGTWEYKPMTPEEARLWYDPEKTISTIGYEETAAVLTEILGHPVVVNKINARMEVGDEALVFRLVFPPGTPRLKSYEKGRILNIIKSGWWELGLLRRIQ
jgi:hypothetical protein